MKIVQINSVCGRGSTGRIVTGISSVLNKKNIENYIFYGVGKSELSNAECIETPLSLKLNILMTRVFGKHGFYSHVATRRLLKRLDVIKPDLIQLHNIHGHYLNVKMLFDYIKKNKIKVVWSLHDCWSFTGHCSHFDYIGCDKWKTGCYDCPQLNLYPVSWFFDRSKASWRDKKRAFGNVEDLTVIATSEWIEGKLKDSFLKKYPIKIIYNGMNVDNFCATESKIREKLGLQDKKVILAICFKLHDRKGGDYLVKLAGMLSENETLVILGMDAGETLPENIIVLPKTSSMDELSQIYTMADVFVNTSLEETLSMVNLEAQACGTPVVAFDSGGMPETVSEGCGFIVKRGDIETLYSRVENVLYDNVTDSGKCVENVRKYFREDDRFSDYVELYSEMMKNKS